MPDCELHVVFGTGPLGMATMQALVARGRRVRMVNRSGRAHIPAGVEVVAADVTDHAAARQAASGAAVIYNCLNAPYTRWPELFPPLQAGVLAAAVDSGARLISLENVYMYGPVHGPMTETLPHAATGRKGRTRARMSEELMEAHASGRVRVAIARASDYYGPHVLQSACGELIFGRIVAGKAPTLMGSLDVPHTYTYIHDVGAAVATLGEHEEALGQVWHVPSAETLTTREFLALVFEEAGLPFRASPAPSWLVKSMGLFIPIMREMSEMLYEFEEPHIVDHSKFVRAFGGSTTPHRTAIRDTVAWYRQHLQRTLPAQEAASALTE